MKKQLIIIAVLVFAVAAMVFFAWQSGGTSISPNVITSEENGTSDTAADVSLKPSEVSVGVYDHGDTASALTDLLVKRLTQAGFQASVVKTIETSKEGESNLATIFYRPSRQAAVQALARSVLVSPVVRQFEAGSQKLDVVIPIWSVDDIAWGSMDADLNAFRNIDPASVAIQVLNAGAATGEAGRIADILTTAGYTKAEGKSGDTVTFDPAIVYYQRDFRSVAKKIVTVLKGAGFPDASYRAQQSQETPIVIMLGQVASSTPASQ